MLLSQLNASACLYLMHKINVSPGVLLGIHGGVCLPFLQILTRLQTRKCNFPHPFSDQTSKIHTGPFSDLAFRQKLCYNYLDQGAEFQIRIFLFLSYQVIGSCSYSFGIKTIKMFIHSDSSLENPTCPRPQGQSVSFSDQNGAN